MTLSPAPNRLPLSPAQLTRIRGARITDVTSYRHSSGWLELHIGTTAGTIRFNGDEDTLSVDFPDPPGLRTVRLCDEVVEKDCGRKKAR